MNAATRTMLAQVRAAQRRLTQAEYDELTLLDRMRNDIPDWMFPDASTPTPEPPVPVIHHLDDPPRVPEPGSRVRLYEGPSLVTATVVDQTYRPSLEGQQAPSADHVYVAYDLQWVYVAADGREVFGDWVDYRLLTVIETPAQRTQRMAQQAAQRQTEKRAMGVGAAMGIWIVALLFGILIIALNSNTSDGAGLVWVGVLILAGGFLFGLFALRHPVAAAVVVTGAAVGFAVANHHSERSLARSTDEWAERNARVTRDALGR